MNIKKMRTIIFDTIKNPVLGGGIVCVGKTNEMIISRTDKKRERQ